MDVTMRETPPRDDVEEDPVPLRDRLLLYHNAFDAARELVHKARRGAIHNKNLVH